MYVRRPCSSQGTREETGTHINLDIARRWLRHFVESPSVRATAGRLVSVGGKGRLLRCLSPTLL